MVENSLSAPPEAKLNPPASRHSPGPFELGTGPHGITLYDTLSRVVATIPKPPASGDERPGSPHTLGASAANVRLLRAAPELRALLAELASTTFARDDDGTDGDARSICARIVKFKHRARRLVTYCDTGDCDFIAVTA